MLSGCINCIFVFSDKNWIEDGRGCCSLIVRKWDKIRGEKWYLWLQLPAIDDMISITKWIHSFLNFLVCTQIPWLTLENIREKERTCTYKEISTLINKLLEDWIGYDTFGQKKRKTVLIWVFKLLSSKNILHAVAQSPNLIHYSRLMLIMTELFGRSMWRISYSKKFLPHHYATERQFPKFTKILTAPHSRRRRSVLFLWLYWKECTNTRSYSQNSVRASNLLPW